SQVRTCLFVVIRFHQSSHDVRGQTAPRKGGAEKSLPLAPIVIIILPHPKNGNGFSVKKPKVQKFSVSLKTLTIF
ncbi:hypothetical protein, partial [Candidatus Allofournierella merdipullorum]|uniref:hypothetical protein n=1 Tax=Candidatus Allofournierella merdipullorum TaxID=2838595 RepID=UPI00374FAAC5